MIFCRFREHFLRRSVSFSSPEGLSEVFSKKESEESRAIISNDEENVSSKRKLFQAPLLNINIFLDLLPVNAEKLC